MDLFLSTKIILSTFTASTATTITICNLYNIPFFNPNHNRYQFYHNITRVIPVTIGILTQSIIVYSFLVHHFIENKPHTIIQNLENIIKYSILAEFIYYIYHRLIHTKDYYKSIHSMHHENIDVYPFDTFYMTKIDSFFLITSLGFPLLVLRMNYYENIISLYIYITAAYFEHSNLFLVHHAKHHKLLFCNFCILNPIFDILVGTYKH
jgi:sterol desaturase/sphingolipid hydroxylase (fatty acid hydroxylase superfamily)